MNELIMVVFCQHSCRFIHSDPSLLLKNNTDVTFISEPFEESFGKHKSKERMWCMLS